MNENGQFTVIYNLMPKADASGFEFVEIARLPGNGAFPRFARFPDSKYPMIVTASGIIEYTENETGKGTYAYRCKAVFDDGHTGYTVADLNGDGTPEIVGPGIYNHNCELISDPADNVASGTVLADLDLVDDHENGRLDVEQIGFVSGGYGDNSVATPPPGKIITYKIYKNEDGKFRRELIWEKPMPVIYSIAENYMSSYKYSDGTPFKCNRKSYDSYMSSGGNSQQYNEWYRRYICATGGGPLVVADFNGDKKPDIGLATGWSYSVFNGTNGVVLWADYNTQDYSSKATGSSLFDFEGDGISEVLYADEIKLHVYKGPGSGVIDPATNTMSAEHLEDDNALTPMTIKLCDESVA